jgi:hypothetical protein
MFYQERKIIYDLHVNLTHQMDTLTLGLRENENKPITQEGKARRCMAQSWHWVQEGWKILWQNFSFP